MLAVGAALLLAGCSAAPEAPSGSEPAAEEPTTDIQPCIVSDEGGFDDRAFYELLTTEPQGWPTSVQELRLGSAGSPFRAWRDNPVRVDY